jgi:secreted trypsin-like serine protease
MVIGGQLSPEEYPFYAQVWSLLDKKKEKATFEFCGGALISDQWILTAGHCIKDSHVATDVALGKNNPEVPGTGLKPHRHVCERIRHPDYSEGSQNLFPMNHIGAMAMFCVFYIIAASVSRKLRGTIRIAVIAVSSLIGFLLGFFFTTSVFHYHATQNDIALLKLCKPVQDIAPVKIWDKIPDSKTSILVMGFGSETGKPQKNLHQGYGNIVPNTECSKHFLRHKDKKFITSGAFCVESEDVFPCKGDSGSPAMIDNQLLGLSSWGSRPCEKHPSVYTFVPKYQEWIQKTINSNSQLK